MTKIQVDFYSKPRCTQCDSLWGTLTDWLSESSDDVEVNSGSVIDPEAVDAIEKHGFRAAPVVRVKRADRDEQWLAGNNPDALIDFLEGRESVWDS